MIDNGRDSATNQITVSITRQQADPDGGRYEASVGFIINVPPGETPEQTVAHWQAVARALVQAELDAHGVDAQRQAWRARMQTRNQLVDLVDHVRECGAEYADHTNLAALIMQLPETERAEWQRQFGCALARWNERFTARWWPRGVVPDGAGARREELYTVGTE